MTLRNSRVVKEQMPGELEQTIVNYEEEKKWALRARFIYGFIFLIVNFEAWFFRDYGQKVLDQFNYIKACGIGGQDCCQTLGVLRVSFGCFIFFFIMFATTVKTQKFYDVRNAWHSGWWPLKLFLLVLSIVFLVLQLVSVIEFIGWWNRYWMHEEGRKKSGSIGLFLSTIFYIASTCGIVVMYILYGKTLECSINIFFITWTTVLLVVMMAISLHSKVNRGLLSSGIMAAYVVFLCWSAIRSEPANDKCYKQIQESRHTDWTTVLSFLIAIGAIVMATFSTGIDSQSFQFQKDRVREEDDIPYDYGVFHVVFALGAMYFAMLFISWNMKNSARKWSIDVGWASTWVKIVNEWFAATIYLWKLISPVVREPKVMDHEAPEQLRNETVMP